MTKFNFKISLRGKYMTTVLNEIESSCNLIACLGEIKNKNLQEIMANGFEVNFDFVECDTEQKNQPFTPVEIESLDLSVRTYNCLKKIGIDTVEDLMNAPFYEVVTARNLCDESLREIAHKLLAIYNNNKNRGVRT